MTRDEPADRMMGLDEAAGRDGLLDGLGRLFVRVEVPARFAWPLLLEDAPERDVALSWDDAVLREGVAAAMGDLDDELFLRWCLTYLADVARPFEEAWQ